MAITSLPSATEFLNNYPKYMAINKDVIYSGPLLMKMIEGDLIRKLCEKISSITEFNILETDLTM